LSARSIGGDSVTIEPSRASIPVGPTPENSVHKFYFSLIQAGLERAFCKIAQVRPGGYRAILKFTISTNGQIREPRVVGGPGSEDRDRMIMRVLDGISLGSSPPADLQQPVMMVILPQSSRVVLNCVPIR
jgi:hypothetical protein